ncbi:MAG: hypothetical protein R3353_00230 [Salegentibacter mishustinae]|jgi:hypothetical protein|nr:hypothetical protein [Salegentibacter mishustinae]
MKTFTLMLFGSLLFGANGMSNSSTAEEVGCSNWSTYESCGQTFHLCQDNFETVDDELDFAQIQHEKRCR